MKLNSSFGSALKFVGNNIPAVTVATFATVVCYYAGYFYWAVGFSIPPIDAQDLGLSSIVLAGLLLTAYNIWQLFDLGSCQTGWTKLLFPYLVTISLVSSQILALWQLRFDLTLGETWPNVVWLAVLVVLLAGFITHQFLLKKCVEFATREAVIFSIFIVSLSWLYGMHAFFSDLQSSKLAQLNTGGEVLDLRVLRIMSSTVVAFDPMVCGLVLLNRSDVKRIGFDQPKRPFGGIEKLNFDCMFR